MATYTGTYKQTHMTNSCCKAVVHLPHSTHVAARKQILCRDVRGQFTTGTDANSVRHSLHSPKSLLKCYSLSQSIPGSMVHVSMYMCTCQVSHLRHESRACGLRISISRQLMLMNQFLTIDCTVVF